MKILSPAIVALFLFFHSILSAQDFNITWGENIKGVESFGDAVRLNNGHYLAIKQEKIVRTNNPILFSVDQQMNPVKETSFKIDEKNDEARTLRRFGSNVYLTYEAYSDKQANLFALRLNQQTLMPEGKFTLATLDPGPFGRHADLIFRYSPDSSKILLFAEDYARKKESKQIFMAVFDNTMKKIWSRIADLPMDGWSASVMEQDVSNEGKVFVAVKHFQRPAFANIFKDDDSKVPYEYKLFPYGHDGAANPITLNLPGYFVAGTKITFGNNGIVTVAGLYKTSPKGNITGAFYNSIANGATEVNNRQLAAFPQDLLALVDKDGQADSKGSDPGIHSHLKILDLQPRRNGTVDLVSEVQTMRISSNPNSVYLSDQKARANYGYGDIIVINLDKTGGSHFTRIPKRQSYGSDWVLGYFPVVHEDKLVLLYNDHEENMTMELSKAPKEFPSKKSVLAAAIIDDKGNLIRKSVFHYREDKRMAIPKNFSRVTDHKFMMLSLTPTSFSYRLGFGSLEIK